MYIFIVFQLGPEKEAVSALTLSLPVSFGAQPPPPSLDSAPKHYLNASKFGMMQEIFQCI